jgi:DNA-binding IclR family transcriptional regulator
MSGSARRALRILETVGKSDRPLGVTEIGRRLDIAAGTAFRGLDALERSGYLARYQASSRYVLGANIARLRQSIFARFPIREICLPYLRQLAFASGETASLTVPVGWYALRIAAAPGINEVNNSPALGEVRALAAGSAGKAILAFQPAENVARYVAWARRQGQGAAAHDAAEAELKVIRKRGFHVEETAFASGRASLALPLRHADRAIAAIAIEGPVLNLDHKAFHDDLGRWIDIVRMIEALARARPALFENPFAHVDAESIVLRHARA